MVESYALRNLQPKESKLPKKKYVVTLTVEERTYLRDLISKGKSSALKQRHARILLKTDQGPAGEHWIDEAIQRALDVHPATVERVRKRFVEEGLEAALKRKEQKNRKAKKIDGQVEAQLVALACSEPPEGRKRWTLQLLADRLVALEIVDTNRGQDPHPLHTQARQLAQHC